MYVVQEDKLHSIEKNLAKNKNCNIFHFISDNYSNLNSFNKENEKIIGICDNEMDLANECYFILDNNIKKVNQIIENFEQELVNTKFSDFSYQNSLLDKNFDELLNFENYLNSNN
jgi:hypothetical protein